MNNFEQYELVKGKRGHAEQSHVPRLHYLNEEYEKLREENKKLHEGIGDVNNKSNANIFGEDDEELKKQLGDKYYELGDMVS